MHGKPPASPRLLPWLTTPRLPATAPRSPAVRAGLGSLLAAGMYEVGRPQRLTVEQALEKERQWQDFGEGRGQAE